MTDPFKRKSQCKACPWKKSTVPARDIPGYVRAKHERLTACRSDFLVTKIMACHESKPTREYACVGWMVNQLGPGNNIPLRLADATGRIGRLKTSGEQYDSIEATLDGEA